MLSRRDDSKCLCVAVAMAEDDEAICMKTGTHDCCPVYDIKCNVVKERKCYNNSEDDIGERAGR